MKPWKQKSLKRLANVRAQTEKKIIEAGGVKLGSQLGNLPNVLVATVFYVSPKIVSDKRKEMFNKEKVEALVRKIDARASIT